MLDIRLGFTETAILFYYYLDINNIYTNEEKIELYKFKQHDKIKWFYTTSGFYDKEIISNYYDADVDVCLNSKCYNDYMTNLLQICIKSTIVRLCFYDIDKKLEIHINEFLKLLSSKNAIVTGGCYLEPLIYLIDNKKVLIINPMASLICEQYNNNNVRLIHQNFPFVKNIIFYDNPYTFFNNGPHNNSFETIHKICTDISLLDFDVAVISCGSISSFIGHYINFELNKDCLIYGRMLSQFFGIDKNNIDKPGWITVPDKYKPLGYEKIEGGCYW